MLLKSPAADKAAGQTKNAGTFIGVSLWNVWRWKLDERVATFTPVHEADSVLSQLIQRKVSGSLLGGVYTSAEQSDWTGHHSYKCEAWYVSFNRYL